MKSSVVCDITLGSLLKVRWCFRGTCPVCLQNLSELSKKPTWSRRQGELCLAYSSILKMEAICFSKMSVDFLPGWEPQIQNCVVLTKIHNFCLKFLFVVESMMTEVLSKWLLKLLWFKIYKGEFISCLLGYDTVFPKWLVGWMGRVAGLWFLSDQG
jgi:hypothetical protein